MKIFKTIFIFILLAFSVLLMVYAAMQKAQSDHMRRECMKAYYLADSVRVLADSMRVQLVKCQEDKH